MDIGKISQSSLSNLYFGGWQLVEEKEIIAQTVDQENTTAGGEDIIGDYSGSEYRYAQSFQLAAKTMITAVEIKQGSASSGSPTGNWTLRIETDNAGRPSGTLANANASVVVTPPGVNTIVKGAFANNFELAAGTYHLKIDCANQSSGVYWNIKVNTSSVYANGHASQSINGSWNVSADNYDLYFKIYKDGPLTSYTISGLNGDVDEEYRLVSRIVNGYNGGVNFRLRLNEDTGDNYGYQYLKAENTTVSAARVVGGEFAFPSYIATLNGIAFAEGILIAKSGVVRTLITNDVRSIVGTTINSVAIYGQSWNNTVDNITTMTIKATDADGLGTGTHLLLFKKTLTGLVATSGIKTGKLNVKGNINCGVMQKIYDSTLAAAVTSVTISGLNGDVDTIYELKVRTINQYNGTNEMSLLCNSDGGANYGQQFLEGANTTISVARYTGQPRLILDYNNDTAQNQIDMYDILLFAKSGYIRPAIIGGAIGISTTTVANSCLTGGVWNNTADAITSITLQSLRAGGLGIGTHIELFALRKKI